MARYCTIPALFGLRRWFEARFKGGCKTHDIDYVDRIITRLEADLKMKRYIENKGYPILARLIYSLFLRPFGWLYYYDVIK